MRQQCSRRRCDKVKTLGLCVARSQGLCRRCPNAPNAQVESQRAAPGPTPNSASVKTHPPTAAEPTKPPETLSQPTATEPPKTATPNPARTAASQPPTGGITDKALARKPRRCVNVLMTALTPERGKPPAFASPAAKGYAAETWDYRTVTVTVALFDSLPLLSSLT